jgi:hypothetical protein
MCYLVYVDRNGMGAHFTRSNCEGFYEVLYVYIQCSGWDWCWYVVEWRMAMWVIVWEDEGTDCENGDSDADC